MKNKIDNRVRFESKEESNQRRIKEALARTPEQRLQFFLELCQEFAQFYSVQNKDNAENFILINNDL